MFRFEIKWITTCKAAIAACEEWQQRKKLQDSLLVNVHLYHQRLQKELRMQMEYIMHFYLYSRLCVVSATSWVTRPEESYRLWCVVVSDLETSWMRRTWSTEGAVAPKTNKQEMILNPRQMKLLTYWLSGPLFWRANCYMSEWTAFASTNNPHEFRSMKSVQWINRQSRTKTY